MIFIIFLFILDIKVNIKMIKNMAKELLNGLMVKNIK